MRRGSVTLDGESGELPLERFTATEGLDGGIAEGERLGNLPRLAHQGHRMVDVPWKAIEVGAVEAGKGLELAERARLVEGLGIHLDGRMGGIAARATAGMLFEVGGVGGAVSS